MELLGLTILTCFLYCVANLYFIWVTHHGNHTIGQRHAFFTFYHMKENETLLNSFIANTTFKSLVSMGAIQYCTCIFFYWTRNSMALRIALYNQNSLMNLKIKGTSLFDCVLLASAVAACVVIALRGSGRIRYNDAISSKAERKKAEMNGGKKVTNK